MESGKLGVDVDGGEGASWGEIFEEELFMVNMEGCGMCMAGG